MAKFIQKRCPFCGAIYDGYSYYGSPQRMGCPVKICPKCKKKFLDKDYQEPAFYSYSEAKFSLKECIFNGALSAFILGALITSLPFLHEKYALTSSTAWAGWIILGILPLTFYIWFSIHLFVNRKKEEEDRKREYRESEARLRNLEYAKMLKDAGFNVPPYFLVKKRDPKDYTKC